MTRFAPFRLERWMNASPLPAERVLGGSGVDAFPLAELAAMAGEDALARAEDPVEARLAEAVARAHGVPASHALVTVGASEADFVAPFALLEPGDVALVESPTYPPLAMVPRALGARVERFERRFEDGFRIDVDALVARIRPGVKLVSFTNPNNPTGQAVDAADLVAVAEACADVGAFVLVDEMFRDLAFDPLPVGHALHPRIVTTGSLTKCYGLSALRCGWVLAAPDVVAACADAKRLTSVVNPSFEMRLAIVAFRERDALLARAADACAANFARLEAFVEERERDLAWVRPQAAPVSAPRLLRASDDEAFARRLTAEERTLVAPASFLDLPGHARIGFGGAPAAFADGLARLGRFLDRAA